MAQNWPGTPLDDDEQIGPHAGRAISSRTTAAPPPAPANQNAPEQYPGAPVDAPQQDQQQPTAELPYDPLGQGDIGFASGDTMVRSLPPGNDEYTNAVTHGILTGKITSAQQLVQVAAQYGVPPGSWDADRLKQVEDAITAVKNGADLGGVGSLEYAAPDVAKLREKDVLPEGLDAAARGAVPFGLGDELGAAVDTVREGGSYSENLHKNRAVRDYDEENHFYARLGGEIVGSLALPSGVQETARTAVIDTLKTTLAEELARGVPLLEAKATAKIAARAAGRRAATQRLAMEGGGYSAAYGAGSSDGNIGDRALGAAASGVAGTVLGAATAEVGSRIGRLIKMLPGLPRATLAGRETAAAAERQGVDILPQDVAGPGIQRATQGTAQTPFGSGPVRRAADELYGSFQGRVDELGGPASTAREVGDTMTERAAQANAREANRADVSSGAVQNALGAAADETSAGQTVQRGLNRWMGDTAARATQLYEAVPIPPAQEATIGNTRQVLNDFTREWESNPQLGGLFSSPRLSSYLGALTPNARREATGLLDAAGNSIQRDVTEGGRLSWSDLSEFRTRVGDMLDDPRLSEKIAPRQLRALYGALTQDMQATAQAAGPGAARAWRRANDYYDGRMKRIKDTLSLVMGERSDRTPNEAVSSLNAMLRQGSTGDAVSFARILRSIPAEDAANVRASLVQGQRGQRFDPEGFAKNWSQISERGKAALLPGRGMREIMDDAAARAASSTRDPLEGKSGEQAFLALERMAGNRGDSAQFQARLAAMAPEEANAARSLIINRLGRASDGGQNAAGDAFSIGTFLTRWNGLTRPAKAALFGDGELRTHMNDLALIAERVKASERLAGHSNTGAVNSLNATTGGLGGAVIALVTGHPIIAAGLAGPAAYQKLSAEVLTSKRFLNWIVRAPNKPNPAAQRAHVLRLTSIANAEPAIANDVLGLQQRLLETFSRSTPARLAADEAGDGSLGVPQGDGQNAQDYPGEELPQ